MGGSIETLEECRIYCLVVGLTCLCFASGIGRSQSRCSHCEVQMQFWKCLLRPRTEELPQRVWWILVRVNWSIPWPMSCRRFWFLEGLFLEELCSIFLVYIECRAEVCPGSSIERGWIEWQFFGLGGNWPGCRRKKKKSIMPSDCLLQQNSGHEGSVIYLKFCAAYLSNEIQAPALFFLQSMV